MRKAVLAAALLALLVHVNAAGNGFAYDDEVVIEQNEALQDPGRLPELLARPYWPGHYGEAVGAWRPLTSTLFAVEWAASGGNPRVFHVVGIVLDAAAAAVVVLVLSHLVPPVAAAAGGLVFAVHPVHVEAVANAVGNAEVLAALLALLALLVHLRGGERYGFRRALAVGALYGAAVLAKEGAAVVPGLVLLVDAARRDVGLRDVGGYARRRGPTWLVLAAVLGALLVARTVVLGGVAPEQAAPGASLLDDVPRIFTLAATWPHYVRLLLFPADLAADYGGVIPVTAAWTAGSVLGVVLVLGFLGLAWWSWRTGPVLAPERLTPRALGVAVLWFGVAVSPVANVAFMSPVLLAERNLYLPSVAAALGLGYLFAVAHRARPRVAAAAAAVVLLAGAARTWVRNPVWHDTWTVFDALLEDHPEAGRAWLHRGEKLFAEGRPAEARRAFSVALGLLDSEYSPAVHVASRLSVMGPGPARAGEFLLRRAWRERPDYYTAPAWLAALYLNEKRYQEGEGAARAALALAPENAELHRVLAAHLSGQGDHGGAVVERRRALALREDAPWSWWVWLARDEAALGRRAEARTALDSARAHVPPGSLGDLDGLEAELLPSGPPA